ncbi:HMG-Y-related protein A [Apostasia shenzhenica]|uniref:HMG-Y-related protein A n=1 Tax=Apostasia shenzhenica TaxID=1088818 RepID=A0A2I0BBF8_9ASPA|nr:HMG-Y-related protein A [Apostasia shenzhenica]
MATTEEESKSASHPPYPEMILAAITALGEKDGSSKSSISKHIETVNGGSLPANHSAALSEALEKMRESGELLLVNDNYLKPDSKATAPIPRRGRGRPPKAKPPKPISPRPRGRPPKPKDPLASAVAKAAGGYPRRRGRPPKKHRPAVAVAIVPTAAAAGGGSVPTVVGVKRGRGRPPKVRPPAADVAAQ